MSVCFGNPAWERAPLLGHNLVRLLYMDESGSDHPASALVVAGVLVHGDRDWPEIDRRMGEVVEKYIPVPDRLGFVFHATDIFHGARYFHRDKPEWHKDRRLSLLADLATIIGDLGLPVVSGGYQKDGFGSGALEPPDDAPEHKGKIIHNIAVMDCLKAADRWLERYSPTELATVVHEDGVSAKRLIKNSVRLSRSSELLSQRGWDERMQRESGLPLKRIIDTVHFADKPGARPLQLADLCAFTLGRVAKDHAVPEYVFNVIWENLRWISGSATDALARAASAQGGE